MPRIPQVGDPFIHEGFAYDVVDVGGKTGKQLHCAKPKDGAAPYDTVTVALAEVEWFDTLGALKVEAFGLPGRLAPIQRGALVVGGLTPMEE